MGPTAPSPGVPHRPKDSSFTSAPPKSNTRPSPKLALVNPFFLSYSCPLLAQSWKPPLCCSVWGTRLTFCSCNPHSSSPPIASSGMSSAELYPQKEGKPYTTPLTYHEPSLLHACCRRGDRGPERSASTLRWGSKQSRAPCLHLPAPSAFLWLACLSAGLGLSLFLNQASVTVSASVCTWFANSLPSCKSTLLASAPSLCALLARTLSSSLLQMGQLEPTTGH